MSETTEQPESDQEFQPITSQEELDKRLSARIARERAKYADYKELQTKAQRLAEIEAANMTKEEQAAQRIQALEAELASERKTREQQQLLSSVLTAKGLSPSDAEFLKGDTQEELEAAADRYLARLASEKPKIVKGSSGGLRSGATGADTRMDPKERAAQALRQFRTG